MGVRLTGTASPSLGAALQRWSSSRWPLLLGLAILTVPTVYRLAAIGWSTEAGAHGPIILVSGLWLFWRARGAWMGAQRQPLLPALLVLLPALLCYAIGRITSVLTLEASALYVIVVTILWVEAGTKTIRLLWFPLIYMLFTITLPENWVFVATRPLKAAISTAAVDLLSAFGLPIGSTGVEIQIGGYQLLVATACSGINSMIGICAIGLFYVYLRHGNEQRYALLLVLLMIPLATAANFLRIIILVLVTYFLGEGVAQGVSHELLGTAMFMLAMLLLLTLDAVLHPLVSRHRAFGREQPA